MELKKWIKDHFYVTVGMSVKGRFFYVRVIDGKGIDSLNIRFPIFLWSRTELNWSRDRTIKGFCILWIQISFYKSFPDRVVGVYLRWVWELIKEDWERK
jgi:hypothetical protein